ncbi:hypothetical protein [Enterococcus casseliflavus]|uniref:hypothetical protein n=1 Tax=Enterococcus casseliflavus TaxID=37734 RepID=UPI0034D24527
MHINHLHPSFLRILSFNYSISDEKKKKTAPNQPNKKAPSENKQVSYKPLLAAALSLLHKRRGKLRGWLIFPSDLFLKRADFVLQVAGSSLIDDHDHIIMLL